MFYDAVATGIPLSSFLPVIWKEFMLFVATIISFLFIQAIHYFLSQLACNRGFEFKCIFRVQQQVFQDLNPSGLPRLLKCSALVNVHCVIDHSRCCRLINHSLQVKLLRHYCRYEITHTQTFVKV